MLPSRKSPFDIVGLCRVMQNSDLEGGGGAGDADFIRTNTRENFLLYPIHGKLFCSALETQTELSNF